MSITSVLEFSTSLREFLTLILVSLSKIDKLGDWNQSPRSSLLGREKVDVKIHGKWVEELFIYSISLTIHGT
jgi:hypothetical protein